MANNIIQAVLDYRHVDTRSVWQYDYGQVLHIQGENLPKAVEVHFSLNEVGGDSITKIGVTTDGITEVQVPDELLENGGTRFKYNIYAFVYIEDGHPCKYFSAEDMQNIVNKAMFYVSYYTTYCNALNMWIKSITKPGDFEQIQWGVKIPEEFQNEVLKDYMKILASGGVV